jgi:hypothetical protein
VLRYGSAATLGTKLVKCINRNSYILIKDSFGILQTQTTIDGKLQPHCEVFVETG